MVIDVLLFYLPFSFLLFSLICQIIIKLPDHLFQFVVVFFHFSKIIQLAILFPKDVILLLYLLESLQRLFVVLFLVFILFKLFVLVHIGGVFTNVTFIICLQNVHIIFIVLLRSVLESIELVFEVMDDVGVVMVAGRVCAA